MVDVQAQVIGYCTENQLNFNSVTILLDKYYYLVSHRGRWLIFTRRPTMRLGRLWKCTSKFKLAFRNFLFVFYLHSPGRRVDNSFCGFELSKSTIIIIRVYIYIYYCIPYNTWKGVVLETHTGIAQGYNIISTNSNTNDIPISHDQ